MIGARAGIGGVALDGIEAVQLRLVAFETPPRREGARVANTRRARAEEVGVEREDDVGLVDRVLRVDVITERKLASGARVMTAGRIPLDPFRLWEPGQKVLHLRGKRRRCDGFRQNPDACALAGFLCFQRALNRRGESAEGTNVSKVGDGSRPVGIVEAENRRLREEIGRPAARRMIGVPFYLRWPPLVTLDQQS